MERSPEETIDAVARQLGTGGDWDAAATAVIRRHGPEVFGFLVAVHRSEEDAEEVFALWSERVWRGLPDFSWECSVRTWIYTVARNASSNYRRDARARAKRAAPLPESSALLQLQREVRTETRPYQRTENKDALAEIRESLPPEDQLLLVLRVDRELAWRDLVRVLADEGESFDEAKLAREAARLRKRFQLLKERLVELARERGILDER